jgi:tripartite-type tricarboxylate transporter receptor subunit TctC
MTFTKWLALLIAALTASMAAAQQYPARSIRLVVGFPPGAGTDTIARLLGQKLGESWGQQVIVDNRAGATGMIGANIVAKSPPDGYTLLMGHVNSQAIAPSLVQKPLYDPLRDFASIAYIGYDPNVLVVHPSTPARNFKELIALAKARPGELTFASSGIGSTNHLAGEMLMRATGVTLVHVPYKGGGAAIIDQLAGNIVMNFNALSSVVNYIALGKMRPLAVTNMERASHLPNVPTLRELGLKDFDVTNWYGIVAPAAASKEIIFKLNAELNRIMQQDAKSRLDELGIRLNPVTPEKFTEYLQTEIAKYQKVAKETGIRMD